MNRMPPGRPLDLALLELLLTGLVLAGVEIGLLIDGPLRPIGLLLLFPLVGTIYLATGLLAWRRRPANRVGALLVFGALTYFGAGLANTGSSALIAAGQIVASLPIVIVLHLLLAFPSGRLRTTLGRGLAGVGYARLPSTCSSSHRRHTLRWRCAPILTSRTSRTWPRPGPARPSC